MLDGEEKLIHDAILGEASAFGLLYDHYQPKIYRFVLARVGRREEAEDLTHQVFLKAWQSIGRYEARGIPFSGWIYEITRNQIIDHYRTRHATEPIDELIDSALITESADAKAEFSLLMRKIRETLGSLSDEQQEVILMRFVDDLPIKTVAAILGKTEGAVKLLQHRAIAELKKYLANHG